MLNNIYTSLEKPIFVHLSNFEFLSLHNRFRLLLFSLFNLLFLNRGLRLLFIVWLGHAAFNIFVLFFWLNSNLLFWYTFSNWFSTVLLFSFCLRLHLLAWCLIKLKLVLLINFLFLHTIMNQLILTLKIIEYLIEFRW